MKKMLEWLTKSLNLKIVKFEKINSGEKNISYLCYTENEKFVLKFLTPQFWSKNVEISEFDKIYSITQFLNKKNSVFLTPYTTKNIPNIIKYKNKYFSLFNYIEHDAPSMQSYQIQEMAIALVNLHDLTQGLKIKIDDRFEFYVHRLFKKCKYRKILNDYFVEYLKIKREVTQCLIHGDYASTNILFKNDKIAAVIDFDNLACGSREEEIIRACRNFDTYDDIRNFVNTYIRNCNASITLCKELVKKFIIKDMLNEICVYYFQMKRKSKIKYKDKLKDSIRNIFNCESVVDKIWEAIEHESFVC